MSEPISRPAHRITKLVTVFGFVALFAGGFVYYLVQTGVAIPGVSKADAYQVSFNAGEIKNLQDVGDVDLAGVVIGHVANEQVDGRHAVVTLAIDPNAAPLHTGATVRVGVKSVVGESYVEVIDGNGAPIPSHTMLPDSSVKPAVDIDEIIGTFDPQTRAALSASLQSLGAATGNTADQTRQLMTGLGELGSQGYTALQAIAAQGTDLTQLTGEATVLLQALDTGRGQIADVVHDADTLTNVTAGQRTALETAMRALPGLLTVANTATAKIGALAGSLAPIATNLRQAAPALNAALLQLPADTADLRGLLPALNGVLDEAPATLNGVPAFGTAVDDLVPGARALLQDVNPMLSYLQPYGRDIGSMFASFGASMDVVAENGVRPVRLAPVFDVGTPKGVPVQLTTPMIWNNPYPLPGTAGTPEPFRGTYPRIYREPQ